MYTYNNVFSLRRSNIMTMPKSFSLTVISLDTGSQISFENSSLICNYRDTISDIASKLGGMTEDKYTITMPSSKEYSDLLFFIASLERGIFSISLSGKELQFFKKTSIMESSWKSIIAHAKELGGELTITGGFDFNEPSKAKEFIKYIQSIEVMEGYNELPIKY